SSDSPPMKYSALAGVLYLGCSLPNQPGSMPVLAMEYTRREAPSSSEFHEVKIPAIPPAMSILAISCELNSAPKAAATAISAWASSPTPMTEDVVSTTMTNQAVAMATEMITRRPILRAGTLTSSADCGTTL